MSKIPLLNRNAVLPPTDKKRSIPSKVKPLSNSRKSNLYQQTPTATPKVKRSFFKLTPSEASMQSRVVPVELQGNAKLIGNSANIFILFKYLKSIGQTYFEADFFNQVFPKALSVLNQQSSHIVSQRIPSKLPQKPTSEIEAKGKDLDLGPVFEKFKSLFKKQLPQISGLTDFLLLYCTHVIAVCDNQNGEKNKLAALFFLKSFLQCEIPSRPQEANLLFNVIIKQNSKEPASRGHSIQVVAQLAQYESSFLPRIQAGANHPDPAFSSFLSDTSLLLNKNLGIELPPPPPAFAKISGSIPENAAAKMLRQDLTLLENGELPQNINEFISNIVQTMKRLSTSVAVLENGSNCVHVSIGQLNPIPIEIASQIIDVCFSILSDSPEAPEAVHALSNLIFEVSPCEILLSAVAATIATTTDSVLPILLNKLSEYYSFAKNDISPRQLNEISQALDAFHPGFRDRPDFLQISSEIETKVHSMTESIERLLSPETVFQEMEYLVQQDSAILNDYPLYLRGFLQRAYFLFRGVEPTGISPEQLSSAQNMVQNYQSITDADIMDNGKYGINTLQTQYDEIKNANTAPSW